MDAQYSYPSHKNRSTSSAASPTRRPPLHQRTESESNSHVVAAIRLVPKTPPRLLGQDTAGRDLPPPPPPLPTLLGLGPGHQHPNAAAPGPGERGLAALDNEFHSTQAQKQSNHPTYSAVLSGSALSSPRSARRQHSFRSAHSATASTRSPSPTSSTHSRPKPRKKRLHVHDDNKTFSLLQEEDGAVPPDGAAADFPDLSFSSTKASSSFLLSDDSHNSQGWDNLKTSCVSTRDIRDLTGSTYSIPSTPASKVQVPISTDPIVSTSPWNYQFVGGLRKVAKTPDLKQKASTAAAAAATATEQESPSLPKPLTGPSAPSHELSATLSFRSTNTYSSERTNYKVYRHPSASPTTSLLPPSSSNSNYQLHQDPSPPSSVIYRPQTAESENENYEVYESSSPAGPYLDLVRHPKYSQESLIVPPLNPKARRPSDHSGQYKQRSRELFRSPSITSISTILSHKEALRAIVGRGSQIQLPIPIPKIKTSGTSSWAESSILYPPRSHMNEHPHQWSSQLSTVLSVSDSGTDRNSRSWSDDNGRVSSNFDSRSSGRASRGRILSVSSEQDPVSPLSRSESRGMSRGDSLSAVSRDSLAEPPQPYFSRHPRHQSRDSIRMVQDMDEHGDGITDMQDLRPRPSRRHMSGFLSSSSSDNGRSNTMRSTTSTRANSLLASSIPAWARLYYGSGERRYLGAPGTSTEGTNTRASSFRSGSPNTDHFPSNIYSPRRRPREFRRGGRGSLDINPAPALFGEDGRLINDPYSRRFRTWSMSSIWSPHLRHDRRTQGRSVWEPPSINWSTGGGVFGRRNVQIVMFTLGFIFPFAWMIASFLPLPPAPMQDMEERDRSTNNLDSRNTVRNDFARQFGPMDEARYESAVWWRKLNRWMSFVGVLIIASVIVLVIIGVKENWGIPKDSSN